MLKLGIFENEVNAEIEKMLSEGAAISISSIAKRMTEKGYTISYDGGDIIADLDARIVDGVAYNDVYVALQLSYGIDGEICVGEFFRSITAEMTDLGEITIHVDGKSVDAELEGIIRKLMIKWSEKLGDLKTLIAKGETARKQALKKAGFKYIEGNGYGFEFEDRKGRTGVVSGLDGGEAGFYLVDLDRTWFL